MNIVGLEESKKRSKQTGLSVDTQNVIDNTYAQNMANDKAYFDNKVTQTNEIYGDNGALKNAIDQQNDAKQSYIDSLSDIVEQADRDRKKMEYENAQFSKRARARQLINAFGDGFSALSNLIGTIKGAAPVEQSLATTKFKAQYDDAKAKRDKMYQDNKDRIRKINEEKGKAELERGLTYANAVANWKANRQAALDDIEVQRRKAEAARAQQRGADEAKALGVQQFNENKKLQREQFAETKRFQREQLAQRDRLEKQKIALTKLKGVQNKKSNDSGIPLTMRQYDNAGNIAGIEKIEIPKSKLETVIYQYDNEISEIAKAKIGEKIKNTEDDYNKLSKKDKRGDEGKKKQREIATLKMELSAIDNNESKDRYRILLPYVTESPDARGAIDKIIKGEEQEMEELRQQLLSSGIDEELVDMYMKGDVQVGNTGYTTTPQSTNDDEIDYVVNNEKNNVYNNYTM